MQIDLDKRPLDEALNAMADRTNRIIGLDAEAARGEEKTAITAHLRNMPLDTAVRLLASIEWDRKGFGTGLPPWEHADD